MTDVIKILESLEKSGLLIDWATNTVKHETKNKKGITWCYHGTYGCLVDSTYDFLIDITVLFIDKTISGKRVT